MERQQSFSNETKEAAIYLVPTPIGNLGDMTFRAVETLKMVDWIAAEDTRNTKNLCRHFEIDTPLFSYHEHNLRKAGEEILAKVRVGQSVAIVSDAGMPAISDPGYELVSAAIGEGIKVIALPGANAGMTALIASGLVPQPFFFYGFLDRNSGKRKKEIARLQRIEDTIILYEAPHRIKQTLKELLTTLGNRRMVIAREITKRFEEYIRGTLSEAVEWVNSQEIRGEFVLVIEGNLAGELEAEEAWWQQLTVIEHVDYYRTKQALKPNDAIKQVSIDRAVPKREIYQQYHVDK